MASTSSQSRDSLLLVFNSLNYLTHFQCFWSLVIESRFVIEFWSWHDRSNQRDIWTPNPETFLSEIFLILFPVASHLLINERIKMSHGLRRREKCTRLVDALEWPNHAINRNWVSSVFFRHNSLATPRLKSTLESYSLQPVVTWFSFSISFWYELVVWIGDLAVQKRFQATTDNNEQEGGDDEKVGGAGIDLLHATILRHVLHHNLLPSLFALA